MAIHISLGGNAAGDGFLIAPLGANYEAEISVWTDAGTASVTLQAAAPNPAGLVFSTAAPISISTVPTVVATVHSTLQSAARGDTTIQVLDAAVVVASFTVTSIKHPVVNFKGRFEARFATDGARPYNNPTYTAFVDTVVPPGRTWALEGELDFDPGSIVPTNLEMTGVGRVVRLNNPIAQRGPVGMNTGEVRPVVSTVDSITGETTMGTEKFTAGDPLIGQPVNFGPDTYLAGNNDSSDTPGSPAPEEYHTAGREPLALFEILFGASFSPPALYFKGASQVSAFTHKAAFVNEQTRTTDSRPITHSNIGNATPADFAEFSLPDQQTYSDQRMDVLIPAFNASAAGSADRRNLNRRIGHLLGPFRGAGPVSTAKFDQVQGNPPGPFTTRAGSLGVDWNGKETFTGKVDTNLHAWPGGPPGASSVVDYLRQFFSFDVEWNAFAFHTDELCGHHIGKLSGDLSLTGNHIGDPHVHTVNGIAYDFQAVGEFTLLRDGGRMEIQVRQTPVATANPIPDAYSGLTECVSINTAVAVRVGAHRISLQPGREGKLLQFYLDGKPTDFPRAGIDLGANRVTVFAASSGETGLRVDFADGTVVLVTPNFWPANNVWHLDVSVSHARGDEGVMGFIPKGSWLPRLRNGVDLGPRPASLHDRYVALYKTFADSWRVNDKTSLFVYAPGTSTKTFTDHDWPSEQLPCNLKPEFQVPGVQVLKGMPVARAEAICRIVTDKNLHQNCVFDVATTGDETLAKGYVAAEELRLYATSVRIGCFEAPSNQTRMAPPPGETAPRRDAVVVVTATVSPLTPGRPVPTGSVTFFIDDVSMNRPVPLDDRGWATVTLGQLKPGEHRIRATYSGGGKFDYHSSSSANQICTVGPAGDVKPHRPDQPVG